MEPLKKLHARWGGYVQFVDVVVRQAHPGPGERPYQHPEDKLRDAQRYQGEEGIPWPVVVDDLPGTVHQAYGSLADPTYLIDADGRVAFYNMWTYAPVLHEAISALREQGGHGVVLGEGIDRIMHLGPALTDGWKGLRRGLPQTYWDMETAAPGSGALTWLGYQLRPLLAPLTLRAEPLPSSVKLGLAVGAIALAVFAAGRLNRSR